MKKKKTKEVKSVCCDDEKGECSYCSFEDSIKVEED